tara:strand:- start:964 stop:1146 length:183 start_codon:yes stop_codon:yes gene_type:complete
MSKDEVEILKRKLKEIGEESLLLINKYKYEYKSRNEDYVKLIKINNLAHECHKHLGRYFQ